MASSSTSSIGPVLVVDAWERMALGACRALGRQGVEVGVAGHDETMDHAATSRYVRHYDRLPDPTGPGEVYACALRELVAERGYVAIVPCHDATLARLATIDLPVPTLSTLDDAWHLVQDKVALAEVCEELGIAYPSTREIATVADLLDVVEELGFPLYLKPAESARAESDRVPFQRGATRVATHDEARSVIERMLSDDLRVIAQATVPTVTKFTAVHLRAGDRSLFRYALRFIREYPRSGGIGVTLETIDPDVGDGSDVLAVLERVCAHVGFEGLVQAEVYRGGDGRLYLIDVNPRLWGSVWFAERLGTRPIERALRVGLGLPEIPPARYPAGRRFHTLDGEIKWLLAGGDLPGEATALLRSLRPGRDSFEYVDLTDPRPNLHWMRHNVSKVGSAALRHRRSRPSA